MYGRTDLGQMDEITEIVKSYLTPSYVEIPRNKLHIKPHPHTITQREKKEQNEKKLQEIVISNSEQFADNELEEKKD